MTQITPNKLAELLARAKAARNLPHSTVEEVKEELQKATSTPIQEESKQVEESKPVENIVQGIGRTGEVITYNSQQLEAINTGASGESFVLIGAAGTGKTTCQQGIGRGLIQSGRVGILEADGHKHLPATGAPGIVICAYTRRATNNIRNAMPDDLKGNCVTIHKLLEYEPIYYDIDDPETGETKTTMRFEATRNALRPLPATIKTIIIEEASMVSVELFREIENACPHNPQFIFLGDIQQLPPVFGSAILGYKMLELKTVELTQVYRQALESPIIRLAHRILSGKVIPPKEYPEWKTENQLTLHPWKKKLSPDTGLLTAAKFFTTAIDHDTYNPEEDMILIPFNKSFGTDELNKHIAQHLARKYQKTVYEVIAGFNKIYLAEGDKVLVEKEDATIISIKPNHTYTGKTPTPASKTLDYWGHDPETHNKTEEEFDEERIDLILSQAASGDEDRVKVASHIVRVRMNDSDREIDIDSASALNAMILGYALTVHKSQGSEWRKVFLVFHQSHATMLQRELLYTAVTRAKQELYVICEPETFTNGILSQRIKGNTLAEKAEYFKGKLESNGGLFQ